MANARGAGKRAVQRTRRSRSGASSRAGCPPGNAPRPSLVSRYKHGYTRSYGHLARSLAPWANAAAPLDGASSEASRALRHDAPAPPRLPSARPDDRAADLALTAAALCVRPRGQRPTGTATSTCKSGVCGIHHDAGLAMRFRGLLRGGTVGKLDAWLGDARQCGIFGMRRFAQTLRQDIGAVRNAMLEQLQWTSRGTDQSIENPQTLTLT